MLTDKAVKMARKAALERRLLDGFERTGYPGDVFEEWLEYQINGEHASFYWKDEVNELLALYEEL